jgi:hypothetical protein
MVLGFLIWRSNDMKGKLKWHLLEWTNAIIQRDGCGQGFEIEEADWIFQSPQKFRHRRLIDVRYSRRYRVSLNQLLLHERKIRRNIL